MTRLSKKKRETLINAAFSAHCSGIQVPIVKIPAIWAAGEAALDAGGDFAAIGAALKEAAQQVALKY